ncbi:single-stranded DNA-binding protein, partial [Sphingomonas sp. Ag1]
GGGGGGRGGASSGGGFGQSRGGFADDLDDDVPF